MSKKTTRAFRTISEASDELELQPHVLRFWESKFPHIKPIKRGGGRRFYRPEDIEFLRGIKILLHDEKHPIKDVQKLIRVKGANRIIELGRSTQKAARDKKVEETILVPERIQKKPLQITPVYDAPERGTEKAAIREETSHVEEAPLVSRTGPVAGLVAPGTEAEADLQLDKDLAELEGALERLKNLHKRWQDFKENAA